MTGRYRFFVLWVLSTVAASYGGYVVGFRLIEQVLARPVDESQTVEGLFMQPAPGKGPAAPFRLLVPRDIQVSKSAVVTGHLTSSSSEFVRASIEGSRVTIDPQGEIAPSAPAFDSWTWSITPTELGQLFVLAKVRDLQRTGAPDTFIAQITVRDEFGFTKTWRQILRVLGGVLGVGLVQGLVTGWRRHKKSETENSQATA